MLFGLLSSSIAAYRLRIASFSLAFMLFTFAISPARGEIAAQNVLVLYNADQGADGAGAQIADYYRQARPGVHLLGLQGIDDILSGTTRELVSADNYLNVIRPQVLAGIAGIPDSIDVIVTTKGLPLKIDAGAKGADSTTLLWRRYSSLESELTRIDSLTSKAAMGDQFIYTGFPDIDPRPASNPYYNANQSFSRVGSDPVNGDIRLSSRLDGYSVETVKQLIDRSQRVFIAPNSPLIVADDDPSANVDQMVDGIPGGPGPGLVNAVQSAGYQNLYENTDEAITTASDPIFGYVSHGTADGSDGLDANYIENQLDFRIGKGAVFLTHESWNARSFDSSVQQSQGLIAKWLEIGGSAGLGHVHEPFNGPDNVTNEDLLFAGLLPPVNANPGESGLTFVEAAWNATRQLSYVNTVVGDPLMKWQTWLPGDTNLDGKVEFKDFYTLQGNWLQSGSYNEGDFDGDNKIDLNDLEILQGNWMNRSGGSALTSSDFTIAPIFDQKSKLPELSVTLNRSANLDGDRVVDADDLALLVGAYGKNFLGDIDSDGDTDGRDFLAWQRQFYEYTLTADFEIDGVVGAGDLDVWQSSYASNRGGDADGDGDTDGRDFLTWQRQLSSFNLSADFDFDGKVGSGDLGLWLSSYANSAGGDADGDGDTDGRDFLIWQRQFSAIMQEVFSSSLTVPEPHSASLLLLLLPHLCARLVGRKVD